MAKNVSSLPARASEESNRSHKNLQDGHAPAADLNAVGLDPQPDSDVCRTGSVDFIVAEILRGLHDGRYVPGQKLTETDLTRNFGVGRGSVREALRKLESEGLVTASLHRGAKIRVFSRDGARDILEVYEHQACLAAALAAKRIGEQKAVGQLQMILDEMAVRLQCDDPFESARLRYRFLAEVVALSRNKELRNMMPRFDVSVLRAQFRNVFDLQFAKEDLEHLKLIVEAILDRDPERAVLAMRQYSRRFGIAIQQCSDVYFTQSAS